MEKFNFCQVFKIIDIDKVIQVIESPMSFAGIREELIRYEIDSFDKIPDNFCAKATFLNNQDTFNKMDRKDKYFNIENHFKMDLKKILLLKSRHLKNAAELITIDTIDKILFPFQFSEGSSFSIKITDLGKKLINENLTLIEKELIEYNYDLDLLY